MLYLPQGFIHGVITMILILLNKKCTCRHKLFLKDSEMMQHLTFVQECFHTRCFKQNKYEMCRTQLSLWSLNCRFGLPAWRFILCANWLLLGYMIFSVLGVCSTKQHVQTFSFFLFFFFFALRGRASPSTF